MSKRKSNRRGNKKGIIVGVLVILLAVGYGYYTGDLTKALKDFGIDVPFDFNRQGKEEFVSSEDNQEVDSNYKVGSNKEIPVVSVTARGDMDWEKEEAPRKNKIVYKIVNNPKNKVDSVVEGDDVDKSSKADVSKDKALYYKGNLLEVPRYDGKNRVMQVNNGKTDFTEEELSVTVPYKRFTPQDMTIVDKENYREGTGRVGDAEAVIRREVLPVETRKGLKTLPTGWRQLKLTDNKTLYDRGHVLAYSLVDEDDNPINLTTQTSQCNKGMGRFSFTHYEDKVRDAVNKGNVVRYRVVPLYEGDEFVPRAYHLQAKTVGYGDGKEVETKDSKGKTITQKNEPMDVEFNVVLYNVNDGVSIDYATGTAVEVE